MKKLTYEYDSVELAKDLRISQSCPRNWLTQAKADERGAPSRYIRMSVMVLLLLVNHAAAVLDPSR